MSRGTWPLGLEPSVACGSGYVIRAKGVIFIRELFWESLISSCFGPRCYPRSSTLISQREPYPYMSNANHPESEGPGETAATESNESFQDLLSQYEKSHSATA